MKAIHIQYFADGSFEVTSYITQSNRVTIESEAPADSPQARQYSLRRAFGYDNGLTLDDLGNGNFRTIACSTCE